MNNLSNITDGDKFDVIEEPKGIFEVDKCALGYVSMTYASKDIKICVDYTDNKCTKKYLYYIL